MNNHIYLTLSLTEPLPPTSVNVTAFSSRVINIQWDAPPNIDEIEVTYYETADQVMREVERTPNDGSFSIHGLKEQTMYTVELRSQGREGVGEPLLGEPVVQQVTTRKYRFTKSVINSPQ